MAVSHVYTAAFFPNHVGGCGDKWVTVWLHTHCRQNTLGKDKDSPCNEALIAAMSTPVFPPLMLIFAALFHTGRILNTLRPKNVVFDFRESFTIDLHVVCLLPDIVLSTAPHYCYP